MNIRVSIAERVLINQSAKACDLGKLVLLGEVSLLLVLGWVTNGEVTHANN